MAHFAKIGFNNVVEEIVVVKNEIITQDGNEIEQLGIDFLKNLYGQETTWVQTSYNGSIRSNYAQIGGIYDLDKDAFIDAKPFDSWILNSETNKWEAPVEKPNDGNIYFWNEYNKQWEQRS